MTRESIQLPQADASAPWALVVNHAALVALTFSLVVAWFLTSAYLEDRHANPLASVSLIKLKADLAQRPTDEDLKDHLRKVDAKIRDNFFRRRAFMVRGSYLLLAGVATLLIALKTSARLNRRPPNPLTDFPPPADPWSLAHLARRAIAVAAMIVMGSLLALALLPGQQFAPVIASTITPTTAPAAPPVALPTIDELKQNWASFRGFNGSAIALDAKYPADWDGEANKGILWKTPIPLPGHNSPVVWKDRLFLSGATDKTRVLFCFDANTGALLWQQPIGATNPAKPLEIADDTSHAPATVATDGQRVFAMFVTGDVGAVDFSGKLLWSKNLGLPENQYGHASSLVVYKDRLIVQFDQGADPEAGKSALLALDSATGKVLWKTKRPVGPSWASPILIHTDKDQQIITCANPFVIAYNPDDGAELWRAKCLEDGEIAPSPVFAGGKVFIANDRAKAAAIKTDGRGDVTATHVLWTAEEGLPDIVSPLATSDFLFCITTSGVVTCYDAATGKQIWQHDFEANFNASPVLAGNIVHLIDRSGLMHRFEAARTFKKLGTSTLGEGVCASPAFVGSRIYIRGKSNLYCIGSK